MPRLFRRLRPDHQLMSDGFCYHLAFGAQRCQNRPASVPCATPIPRHEVAWARRNPTRTSLPPRLSSPELTSGLIRRLLDFHQAFCAQLQAALTTAAWKMNFRGLELLRTCHITKDVLFLDDSMSSGRVCPHSVGGTRNFDFAHFSNKMSQLHSLVWICLLQGPELTAS